MGLVSEFKEFATRGNVIDLAVGVVIGTAFGKIVSSLVEKIIMPIVGYLTGGFDIVKDFAPQPIPDGPVIGVGAFLQTIIDFLIIAAAIFLLVKFINVARSKLERKKAEEPAPAPSEDILLLREIRDALVRSRVARVEK
jgi:large conductance mechanosensitive channel